MATYVNDLRLKEIATGDESGTWGTSTNTNLSLIADAFSYATKDCFATDADATETMADGSADEIRSLYLKVTSSATLTATRTLTLAPNTVSKVWIIENATTGSQSINISQGSGANVTIPNGDVKVIYTDGAGATAAVTDAFTDLNLAGTTTVAALDAGSGSITTTGTVTGTTLAGTLSTAAQTNITSVGTLTGLTVSGDATFDTNTLYVDSTNNRVGIGTSSPADKLHVEGNIYLGTSNRTIYTGGSGNLTLQNNTGNIIFLRSNGSNESMRIDSSGNVGIGTSSANVSGYDSNATALTLSGTNRGLLEIRGATGANSTQLGAIRFLAGSTSEADIICELDGSGNGFLTFDTNGSEAMRIDSSGNVGIGTTSPTDYYSDRLVVTAGNEDGITIAASATTNANYLMFADGTTGNEAYRGWLGYDHNTDSFNIASHGYLRIYSGSTTQERMRIDSSGNVGIGTSSPAQKFTVYGSDNNNLIMSSNSGGNSNTMRIQANDAASYIVSSAAVPLIFDVQSAEKMRIHNGGTVSIGSSNSNGAIFAGNPPSLYAYASGVSNKVANFHYGSTDNYEAVEFGHARATGGNTAIVIGFRNASGTSVGTISMTATNTAYNTSSDARLKDVTGEARGLEVINGLNPVSYNWKESGMADEGLLAQEVMEIVPNAVVENNKGYYFMDYSKLITPLIKAVQEQQTLIEQLQARLEILENA